MKQIDLKNAKNIVFVLPALLFYTYFVFIPVLNTIRYSFFEWDGVSSDMTWVGLQNFSRLLRDETMWQALSNNAMFTVGTIAIAMVMGLLLAVILVQSGVGMTTFFRVAFFTPVILSMIVIGIVWSWIYHPQYGTVNAILRGIGLESLARPWIGHSSTVMPSIIFVGIWHIFGFFMMIYIAGLQSIDPVYYEVARMDGARWGRQFISITVPMLRNTTTLLIVWAFIWSFRIFELVFQMTGGGPHNSSEVVALYMFKRAFRLNETGYGSAISVTLALVIMVFSVFYIRRSEKRDA